MGMLLYQDSGPDQARHYLKFVDGGYWLKGGADSQENMLGYADFDNTQQILPPEKGCCTPSHHILRTGKMATPAGITEKGKGIIGAAQLLIRSAGKLHLFSSHEYRRRRQRYPSLCQHNH